MNGPGHHLQHIPVERRQEAVAIGSSGTVWMNLIVVFSCTHDGEELLKRVASFGPPSLVWSQVAGVKVGQLGCDSEGTEVPAAAQIGGWIDMLGPGVRTIGRRQEVGVSRAKVLGR